jgi:long-subunit fatty acid transport protein
VFSVVPEAGLTIGYRITPQLSVFSGYTFLYASDVVRAPQQVNRQVNPTGALAISSNPSRTLVGPAEPSFKFNASDFWAQGLNVGVAYGF